MRLTSDVFSDDAQTWRFFHVIITQNNNCPLPLGHDNSMNRVILQSLKSLYNLITLIKPNTLYTCVTSAVNPVKINVRYTNIDINYRVYFTNSVFRVRPLETNWSLNRLPTYAFNSPHCHGKHRMIDPRSVHYVLMGR